MSRLKNVPRITASYFGFTVRIIQFCILLFVFYFLYSTLLDQFLDGSKSIYPLLGLWLLTAYAAAPRLHRLLTKYYLPNYFVGRVRSPDGLLSDPVNLAFFGSEKNIHAAMRKAGWEVADPFTPKTLLVSIYSIIFRKSYPNAPVGPMYLFNRQQDFAYQQQVGGTPNRRHHVRFWKTPSKWYLPGGYAADWLAAATYDTHVGLKIATGQINHVIHEHIDEERDYIISTLDDAGVIKLIETVEHYSEAFHDRNNGGDRIKTDGALPFIHL